MSGPPRDPRRVFYSIYRSIPEISAGHPGRQLNPKPRKHQKVRELCEGRRSLRELRCANPNWGALDPASRSEKRLLEATVYDVMVNGYAVTKFTMHCPLYMQLVI